MLTMKEALKIAKKDPFFRNLIGVAESDDYFVFTHDNGDLDNITIVDRRTKKIIAAPLYRIAKGMYNVEDWRDQLGI